MVNDTTLLLGLDGVTVTRVVAAADGVQDGPVVHLATADERAKFCPECGVAAVRMKEWVTTSPRDLPVAGRGCALRWRKRRWCCDQASCPRQTFTEQVPQIPARSRLTRRLRQATGAAVGDWRANGDPISARSRGVLADRVRGVHRARPPGAAHPARAGRRAGHR